MWYEFILISSSMKAVFLGGWSWGMPGTGTDSHWIQGFVLKVQLGDHWDHRWVQPWDAPDSSKSSPRMKTALGSLGRTGISHFVVHLALFERYSKLYIAKFRMWYRGFFDVCLCEKCDFSRPAMSWNAPGSSHVQKISQSWMPACFAMLRHASMLPGKQPLSQVLGIRGWHPPLVHRHGQCLFCSLGLEQQNHLEMTFCWDDTPAKSCRYKH